MFDFDLLLSIRIGHVQRRFRTDSASESEFPIPEIEAALASMRYVDRLMPHLIYTEPALRYAWNMGEKKIEALIQSIATNANHGAGQVYELYAERFTARVNRLASSLHPLSAQTLIAYPTSHGDYYSSEVIEEWRQDSCCHGLDADTCPCGCFEDYE